MKKRFIYGILLLLLSLVAVYTYLFYPQQSMPVGEPIYVTTIDSAKYHNDCLHPCVRYDVQSKKYYMAQSPYYGWNSNVENPMFYSSNTYREWHNEILLSDTPEKGFNSDPNLCLCTNGELIYIWREAYTPLCKSLGSSYVVVGGKIEDEQLIDKQILCKNCLSDGDITQCPIMIEHNGERYIYAAWYQYEPERKNKGIAFWREDALAAKGGGHMCRYQFVDTIPFESCMTVDRAKNISLFSHIFYIPKPLFHDMWHFDLFEYDGKLWMVSVAEKGDNIMLSVAEDWKHFKTFRKPLINNHYTENYCGYRQYYYKPTAFVKDDSLHVFYTANSKGNPNHNQLYHTSLPAKNILK